jgi:mannose-6-phosphate isomerase-like protein (cupin superfamily)
MLRPGDHFENPRTGASIEVLRAPGDGERDLELRRVLAPGTGRAFPHVHLDYVERFVIERGRAEGRSGGRRLGMGPGDELVVPAGERHENVLNRSGEEVVMRHLFEPVPDFILGYVETLGNLMREDRADRQGETPLSATFGVADATDSQTFAVGLPHALQRSVVAPLGARAARLRGFELHLPA